MISRDERIIRENGGAKLLDDPMYAQYAKLVSGRLVITEAQRLDYANMYTRRAAAAKYHMIAMILIRVAGNFLENWTATGHKLNQQAYNVASHLYNRAAFAMRQAPMAELFANCPKYSQGTRSHGLQQNSPLLRERTWILSRDC